MALNEMGYLESQMMYTSVALLGPLLKDLYGQSLFGFRVVALSDWTEGAGEREVLQLVHTVQHVQVLDLSLRSWDRHMERTCVKPQH